MRDWRSGIVTITVRDQRYREHDPILGVVPLRISDILQTSSQVTRWYPLDGGIVSTGRFLIVVRMLMVSGLWTYASLIAVSKCRNKIAT